MPVDPECFSGLIPEEKLLNIYEALKTLSEGGSAPGGVWPITSGGTGRQAIHHASLKKTTGSQSLTESSFTKITFSASDVLRDTGAYFDDVNDRMKPAAGNIRITAIVSPGAATIDARYMVSLYKNGVRYIDLDEDHPRNTNITIGNSVTDEANGADYYELYVFTSASGSVLDTAVFQIDDIL